MSPRVAARSLWQSEGLSSYFGLHSVMKRVKLPKVAPVRDVCVENMNACSLVISCHI